MRLFVVLWLFYPFWGVPLHLVFNFFLSRALERRNSAMMAWSIALAVNIVLFTPLVSPSTSLFGDIYLPWYLAAALDAQSAQFSLMGLNTVMLLSGAGSALWIFNARQSLARP